MGLDSRKLPTSAAPMTGRSTRRLAQDTPEKLPMDQLCRLTMLASLAKVTTNSVTAEQRYPIITPLTTSRDIWCSHLDRSSTKPMDSMAPAKAARIIPPELITTPRESRPTIARETVSLAPEEIPSTKGLAMGLAKKAWRRKPDTDRAPPSRAAARVRGRRSFQITAAYSPSRRTRMSHTSPGVRGRLPAFRLQRNRPASSRASSRKARHQRRARGSSTGHPSFVKRYR